LSLNSYSSKQTTNSNVYKTNTSHTPFDATNNAQNLSSHHNQHHFYKLTSTSKEVDIDSQNYSLHSKTHSHLAKKNHNENLNDSNLSYNIKNLKNTSMNHQHQHQHHRTSNHNDSNSYDRVNDWLSSGFQQQQESQNSNQFKNEPLNKNCNKELEAKLKQVTDNENVKTTVAYYLPGEDLAYISTYNGKNLTLAQFKQFITKKGNFRYALDHFINFFLQSNRFLKFFVYFQDTFSRPQVISSVTSVSFIKRQTMKIQMSPCLITKL
jgi:hypothetical protein